MKVKAQPFDAGLVTLERTPCDAGEMLDSAARLFDARAREKGIDLSVNRPTTPMMLHCDRARIEMALSNLLDNAIKFTPQGGRVIASAEQSGDVVRLWVQDEGSGIASDDQPHIFERFYQGHSAQTLLAHGGSGLGLAIVQSIVHAHGGRIIVATEVGRGGRFVIELPASTLI